MPKDTCCTQSEVPHRPGLKRKVVKSSVNTISGVPSARMVLDNEDANLKGTAA